MLALVDLAEPDPFQLIACKSTYCFASNVPFQFDAQLRTILGGRFFYDNSKINEDHIFWATIQFALIVSRETHLPSKLKDMVAIMNYTEGA